VQRDARSWSPIRSSEKLLKNAQTLYNLLEPPFISRFQLFMLRRPISNTNFVANHIINMYSILPLLAAAALYTASPISAEIYPNCTGANNTGVSTFVCGDPRYDAERLVLAIES
jgi:hypothetical protein